MTLRGKRDATPPFRDFSDMPDDALRALAYDVAHPAEAMKRIRAARRLARTNGEYIVPAKEE